MFEITYIEDRIEWNFQRISESLAGGLILSNSEQLLHRDAGQVAEETTRYSC